LTPDQFSIFFAVAAFVLGASIGSFLNVCIYRMPRDLSVNEPRRSFCPACKYQIPWWHNLPLLSWLLLRGKCANCASPISFRYFGVELLTALLFLAVWLKVWPAAWVLALPYFVLVSLFVVATFIDFEHFIIPDEITWGGAAAGLLLSFAVPPLQGEQSHLMGGLWSLIGAVAGWGLLRLVVELGKLAFGKKKIVFEQAEPFRWERHDQDADFHVGPEKFLWSDFFARGNEQLLLHCTALEIDGEKLELGVLRFTLDWVHHGERKWALEKIEVISGEATELTFPREAMGLGDVKFMACIGAFLGWQAILFTVMSASMIGAVIGVLAILLRRREWSAKIPFGPYLALGALIWLFAGPQIVHWYLSTVLGPSGPS
jgi:leader peptidase (prepilin peptidase)/N-methyltransferase